MQRLPLVSILYAPIRPGLIAATIFFFWNGAIARPQSFSFQPGATYPVQNAALATVNADFNRDGKLDLAVASAGSSTVSIFLGKGDGRFNSPTTVTIPGGCLDYMLAAGDFNKDGNPDLVAVCGVQPTVWFLPGLGTGQFGTPVSTTLPQPTVEGWIDGYFNNFAVADFNGDGALDLVLVTGILQQNAALELDLVPGNGDGTFGTPSPILQNYLGGAVVTADFDGDGKPDLAIDQGEGSTPSLAILRGDGKGSFQTIATYPTPGSLLIGSLAVADLNRDGKPDLIVAAGFLSADGTSESTVLTVFIGNGDCTFKAGFSTNESGSSAGMAVADFLGTGTPDLVEEHVQPGDSGLPIGGITMTIRAGNGDGTFQNPVMLSMPSGLAPWWFHMAAGDWNGDGLTDLAFTVTPSSAVFIAGDTSGSIAQAVTAAYQAMPPGDLVVMLNSLPPRPTRFIPITPCRVADTRNTPNGPFAGPALTAQSTRDFVIPNSACGIPETATAYSLNVAVVPNGPLGYLTLWPSGQNQPLVATLNSDGRIKSNAAIVPAGENGAISVYATNPTDVILDINGYLVPASTANALAFYPVTPCRVADTRNATGPLGGPSLAAQGIRAFPILASPCGVPGSARAYSLNFAAVTSSPLGYLTAWPAGQAQPLVASLNDPVGTVVANAVIVPAGTGGGVNVYSTNATDLVIDLNGYFAPPGAGGLSFYATAPCRTFDSRLPAGTPPFATAIDVNVAGSTCQVPIAGQAYVFNATAVPPGLLGYITMWPQGQTQPLAATLNSYDGAVTNNLAIVPTTSGSISVYPSQPTHLVLDIFGYFAP